MAWLAGSGLEFQALQSHVGQGCSLLKARLRLGDPLHLRLAHRPGKLAWLWWETFLPSPRGSSTVLS